MSEVGPSEIESSAQPPITDRQASLAVDDYAVLLLGVSAKLVHAPFLSRIPVRKKLRTATFHHCACHSCSSESSAGGNRRNSEEYNQEQSHARRIVRQLGRQRQTRSNVWRSRPRVRRNVKCETVMDERRWRLCRGHFVLSARGPGNVAEEPA